MHKNREFVKVAIWVGSGLLAGALITAGLQSLISSTQPRKAALPADSQAENSNTTPDRQAKAIAEPAVQPQSNAVKFASPCPVSTALTYLNNASGMPATNLAPGSVSPGVNYSQTTSGYPIYTGGRAVDSPGLATQIPCQSQPMLVPMLPSLPVGRNGLLSNPCVDPASCRGLAYSRHYN